MSKFEISKNVLFIVVIAVLANFVYRYYDAYHDAQTKIADAAAKEADMRKFNDNLQQQVKNLNAQQQKLEAQIET